MGPIEHFVTFIDHEDTVAHLLGNIHVMSAEQDGCSFVSQIQNRLLQQVEIDRIEPAEGFVENHQLWA